MRGSDGNAAGVSGGHSGELENGGVEGSDGGESDAPDAGERVLKRLRKAGGG